eukprot:396710_1
MTEVDIDSTTKAFLDYDFESDEGWMNIIRTIEFSSGVTEESKRKFLMKKRANYYKEKINPEFKSDPKKLENFEFEKSDSNSASPKSSDGSQGSQPQGAQAGAEVPESNPQPAPPAHSSARAAVMDRARKVRIALNYTALAVYSGALLCAIVGMFSPAFFRRSQCLFLAVHFVQSLQVMKSFALTLENAKFYFNTEPVQLMLVTAALMIAPTWNILIAPGCLRAVLFCAHSYTVVFQTFAPTVHRICGGALRNVISREQHLLKVIGLLEAVTGFFLVFSAFFYRTVMPAVLYWQLMRIRYIQNYWVRAGFTEVRGWTDRLFWHARCPQMLTRAYTWVCSCLYSFVDPEKLRAQAQQAPQQRCSVM